MDIVSAALQHLIQKGKGRPLKIPAASKFSEVFLAAGIGGQVRVRRLSIAGRWCVTAAAAFIMTILACFPAARLVAEVSPGGGCADASAGKGQPERACFGHQGDDGQPVWDINRLATLGLST